MKDDVFKVFLISQALKDNLKRPYISFIEKDFNASKLYFKAFIEAERKSEKTLNQQPIHFLLHQIGSLDKNFTFKPQFIYITDSYALFEYKEYEVSQLSIDCAGKLIQQHKIWHQSRNFDDKIRSAFNGRIIEK